MKFVKRCLPLFPALILSMFLSACSDSPKESPTKPVPATEPTTIKDWLMPTTPDTITVPPFVGQMFDTVTSNPDYTKYYRFEKVEETSDEPVGYILKQDPVAGRSVTPSENKKLITLTVSSGRQAQYMPDTITVPSFVGQMFDTVTSNPDYTKYYRFEKVEETSDYPVGYILKQDPVAGRSVTPSENKKLITLTVSSGPQAKYMPNFLNEDYRVAESTLRGMNLNLDIHLEAVASEEYTKGYIFEQVPAKGTELTAGMSVYLTYSSGPEVPKAEVPDLYNLTEVTAMSRLEGAKLNGKRMEDYDDTVQKGRVFFQNLEAWTEVEQGTEIEFFVSLGPDPATTQPPETDPGDEGEEGIQPCG